MRTSSSLCALALLCALTVDGTAQTDQTGPTRGMSAGSFQRHGMETVRPDGARTALSPSTNFKLDHEQPRTGESLVDVTRRKGYVVDPGTVEAVRQWNPGVQSTITPLRPGETLTFVRPAERPDADAKLAVVPGAGSLAPFVFKASQADIADLRTTVQGSQGRTQFSAQDHQRLELATNQLARANAVFDARVATMSTRQQALAAIQIEGGTAQIRSATVATSAESAAAVQAGAALAADADSFSRALPSGPRRLRVVVRPSPSGRTAEPMAVYVLPLGLVRYGPSTDESKLRNLIDVLAFAQPTSPALGDVEPGLKYAVWVGPRHSVEMMARLIKTGAVQKYIPVDATAVNLSDVVFDESDQVRAP